MIQRLRDDPKLKWTVQAARAWGVPVSELQGRIPVEGEPRWLPKDRQLALAITELEATTHNCGYPLAEAFDEANEARFEAERSKCFACAALDKEAAAIQQEAAEKETELGRLEVTAGRIIHINKTTPASEIGE